MIRKNWQGSWCARVLIISLCALVAAPVGAAEEVCDPKDPKKCARPLSVGEKAPFTGQLLTPRLSIDLSIKAHFCQDRINLELESAKKSTDLVLALEHQLNKLAKESWERQKTLLLERLEEAQCIHWYERPVFIVAATVVATFLLVWAARETLKTW